MAIVSSSSPPCGPSRYSVAQFATIELGGLAMSRVLKPGDDAYGAARACTVGRSIASCAHCPLPAATVPAQILSNRDPDPDGFRLPGQRTNVGLSSPSVLMRGAHFQTALDSASKRSRPN
jgi:hypothetical protein